MNKILITGGTGLVGKAFEGYDNIVLIGNREKKIHEELKKKRQFQECYEYKRTHFNLRNYDQTKIMMKIHIPDQIIHLAAKVGGVKANSEFVGEYFRDNSWINTNVIEAAREYGIQKMISLLSTCIYPSQAPYPLSEKDLHNGSPDESNFGYAFSKRMLEVQSRAYRKQYGVNYITAVPNNLYGENDNFENVYSHVVPALIRKMYEAKLRNQSSVKLWGTGEALREFTYSGDIAKILMMLLDTYSDEEPINIGNTDEISIKSLANLIKEEVGFEGEIIWDITMPTGQIRKPSDNTKFKSLYPEFVYTTLEDGISQTCDWFIKKYPNIRGIK